jgi:hypothetical protein
MKVLRINITLSKKLSIKMEKDSIQDEAVE